MDEQPHARFTERIEPRRGAPCGFGLDDIQGVAVQHDGGARSLWAQTTPADNRRKGRSECPAMKYGIHFQRRGRPVGDVCQRECDGGCQRDSGAVRVFRIVNPTGAFDGYAQGARRIKRWAACGHNHCGCADRDHGESNDGPVMVTVRTARRAPALQ